MTATGVTGAFAINVAFGTSDARVDNTAVLNLGSAGALQVNAAYTTTDVSDALSIFQSNPSFGIGAGASIAINSANNTTHAVIGSASIANAGSISVLANAAHTVTTEALGGAVSAAAFGASVAVGATDSTTTAEMLAGGSTLSVSGAVNVTATHSDTVTTTADSRSAGPQIGAGASLALNIGLDSDTARLGRNLNAGGNVTVAANATDPSSSTALAGQNGGFGSLLIDQEVSDYFGLPVWSFTLPISPSIAALLGNASNTVTVGLPSLGAAAAISVNVAQPKTLAEIAANTSVTSAGTVSVGTSVDYQATSDADASSILNTANIGLALGANLAGGSNTAQVDSGATISANSIAITAGEAAATQLTAVAQTGAGGIAAGAAGSVTVNAGASTTQAAVADNANLTSSTTVSITATSNLLGMTEAGGGALGLAVGLGGSLAANLSQHLTEATVGNAQINAAGAITVDAISTEAMGATAIAGSGALLATIAGSITIDAVVATTEAIVNVGAQLNQITPANAAQSIAVLAQDTTGIVGRAGVLSAAYAATGSASVDASAVVKQTVARLGGKVNAGGNITVDALSTENENSWAATGGLASGISIAGAGSLQHLNVTTEAYIDSGANVSAHGSIRVNANEASRTEAEANSLGITDVASPGGSVAVGWNTKLTEAFIAGADSGRADPFNAGHTLCAASVHADGATPVDASNGSFTVTFGSNVDPGGIGAPGQGIASALSSITNNSVFQAEASILSQVLGYLTPVVAPPLDNALTEERGADVATSPFLGVAVTATTRDAVSTLAAGGSGFFRSGAGVVRLGRLHHQRYVVFHCRGRAGHQQSKRAGRGRR